MLDKDVFFFLSRILHPVSSIFIRKATK